MGSNTSNASFLQLTIGSSTFTASLLDNPTTLALQSLLPLNLQMSELNGNEKYADLPTTLPTAAANPGSIMTGDLMLYGSRTLVLWYQDYSSSYTYTRIGAIQNTEGLANAIGSRGINVTITTAGSTEPNSTINTASGPSMTPFSNEARRVSMNGTTRKAWFLLTVLGLSFYC